MVTCTLKEEEKKVALIAFIVLLLVYVTVMVAVRHGNPEKQGLGWGLGVLGVGGWVGKWVGGWWAVGGGGGGGGCGGGGGQRRRRRKWRHGCAGSTLLTQWWQEVAQW